MQVTAVIVAAGEGTRLKSKVSKPLIEIHGRPLIWYSLSAFEKHPAVDWVVVVANKKNFHALAGVVKKYKFKKAASIVLGGARRQDSVLNGLRAASPADIVLIHDAARPFVEPSLVTALIAAARKYGAAIAGVPVKPTIKQVRPHPLAGIHAGKSKERRQVCAIEKTLPRQLLWEAQTPQAFQKKILDEAYAQAGRREVTDEAMLVELAGGRACVVSGSYSNIKVTTPEDVLIAQAIAKSLYGKSR